MVVDGTLRGKSEAELPGGHGRHPPEDVVEGQRQNAGLLRLNGGREGGRRGPRGKMRVTAEATKADLPTPPPPPKQCLRVLSHRRLRLNWYCALRAPQPRNTSVDKSIKWLVSLKC
jgi:hypothetical protein